MAEAWGILAQVDMGAGAAETVYTVPAGTTIIASLRVTNRTGAAITIRHGVDDSGGGDTDPQWESYDYSLPANDSVEFLIIANATDLVRGFASAVDTSWVLRGLSLT